MCKISVLNSQQSSCIVRLSECVIYSPSTQMFMDISPVSLATVCVWTEWRICPECTRDIRSLFLPFDFIHIMLPMFQWYRCWLASRSRSYQSVWVGVCPREHVCVCVTPKTDWVKLSFLRFYSSNTHEIAKAKIYQQLSVLSSKVLLTHTHCCVSDCIFILWYFVLSCVLESNLTFNTLPF